MRIVNPQWVEQKILNISWLKANLPFEIHPRQFGDLEKR